MRASAPTKDSSRTTASGSCRSMSSAIASWICFKRSSGRSLAGVCHQPNSTALRRPPLAWTIPYPHAAVPGSIPRTFTHRGYARERTFLPHAPSGQDVRLDARMLGTPLTQVSEDLQPIGSVAFRPHDSHLADILRPGLGRTAVLEEKAPQVFEQGWITHFNAHVRLIGRYEQEGLGNPPLPVVDFIESMGRRRGRANVRPDERATPHRDGETRHEATHAGRPRCPGADLP